MLFLYHGCNKSLKEAVNAKTPPDVVKLLLQAIEQKDWETAYEYLSSDFLKDNKEKVMTGAYFKRSRAKDKTAFYTSQARVCPEWKVEKDGALAIVTLNIGGGEPGTLMGICEVKLVKDHGHWKVTEF